MGLKAGPQILVRLQLQPKRSTFWGGQSLAAEQVFRPPGAKRQLERHGLGFARQVVHHQHPLILVLAQVSRCRQRLRTPPR